MKRYKELVEQLNEGEYNPGNYAAGVGHGGGYSAVSDLGNYRVELDEIVFRVNTFIREFSDREFLDPTSFRNTLKTKLNLLGLDFQCDSTQRVAEGNYSYPLLRFGGSFGTTPEHDLLKDGFKVSDMISEFAGSSMVLQYNVSKNDDSMFIVDAKIKPGNAGE
jgi:hypothetical protein